MSNQVEQTENASTHSSEDEPDPIPKGRTSRTKLLRFLGLVIAVGSLGAFVWLSNRATPPHGVDDPSVETPAIGLEEIQASALLPIDLDQLSPFSFEPGDVAQVSRAVDLHTIIPSRPRIEILKYEVKQGDNLFGISERFNLKPETIFWGNWYTMGGDPHLLRPGQSLNILPVDGVLHIWTAGEGLNGVAKFYGVSPEEIINWPGNDLDLNIDRSQPDIEEGMVLVVPGGRREPPSWQMVRITRSDPAVARVLGPGYCGSVYSGSIGDSVFGWPTASSGISGYYYIPGVHEAIDIGGAVGVGISASDDGVVVYSGWNDWGYGLVVVIDHGTGWQTLYAHLSQINAGCGQSVSQGELIGLMGCSGNCTGAHLHFEMRHDSWGRVDPLSILP
jgi:hypothetical protein